MINPGLIVVGMHRSGTSAVAGVLHLLGADVGSRMLAAQEDVNPEGFWELADVVALHDRLFGVFGSGWWDVMPVPASVWEPSVEELAQLVQREFAASQLWVVKDPRLCRFLALWKASLNRLGSAPKCLIVLRHPKEVADSLVKRDGISYPHAFLLWLRYVLDAEKESGGMARSFMTYEELLADWRASMSRVSGILGLDLNLRAPVVADRVDAFVKPHLRHHVARCDTPASDLLALATAAYEALQVGNVRVLDSIAAEAEVEMERNIPWVKQVGGLMTRLQSRESQVMEQAAEIAALRTEIARVKGSLSWQVTKPLRAAVKLVRK